MSIFSALGVDPQDSGFVEALAVRKDLKIGRGFFLIALGTVVHADIGGKTEDAVFLRVIDDLGVHVGKKSPVEGHGIVRIAELDLRAVYVLVKVDAVVSGFRLDRIQRACVDLVRLFRIDGEKRGEQPVRSSRQRPRENGNSFPLTCLTLRIMKGSFPKQYLEISPRSASGEER